MFLLFATLSVASATAPTAPVAYVCPPTGTPDPTCTHTSVDDALDEGYARIQLAPGAHPVAVTVDTDGLELWGDPGAVLIGDGFSVNMLQIAANDVTVHDLEIDATPFLAPYRPLRVLPGASNARVEDVEIHSGFTFLEGAVWVEGELTCERCDLHDNESDLGGALHVDGTGIVTFVDSSFTGNSSYIDGGAVHSRGLSTFRRTGFDDNEAVFGGGHVWMEGGEVTLDQCELLSARAEQGGAVRAGYGSTLQVWDSTFVTNRAWRWESGGGLFLDSAFTTEVTGSWFEDHTGSAIRNKSGDELIVRDTVFDRNRTEGAVWATRTATLSVSDSWFCDNEGPRGGGVRLHDSCDQSCEVRTSTFVSNVSLDDGGAVRLQGPFYGPMSFEGLSLVDNRAERAGAIFLGAEHPELALQGIIAWDNESQQSTEVIKGIAPVGSLVGMVTVYGWNNDASTLASDIGTSIPIDPPPALHDTWQPCGGVPALIDCTDPAAYELLTGPAAVHSDDDGVPDLCDCDPTDGAVNPDATELAGDGVDQDCDGLELCYVDLDGDTFGDPQSTALSDDLTCRESGLSPNGDDCDDANPDRFPEGPVPCDDGTGTGTTGTGTYSDPTDTDPYGTPDDGVPPVQTWLGGGASCDCDHGAAGAGWVGLLPLLLVGLRRQRAAASPSRKPSSAEP